MGEYIGGFLGALIRIALIIAAVVFVLKLSGKEKPSDIYHIKLPRIFFIVGIIITALFSAVSFLASFLSDSRYTFLYFLPYVILGIIIMLCCLNWEIHINGDIATYRNMFRRSYIFSPEEVESIRITKNVIRIKVKGRTFHKTFWIDPYAMNLQSLAAFLRKNADLRSTIHQGRHILH